MRFCLPSQTLLEGLKDQFLGCVDRVDGRRSLNLELTFVERWTRVHRCHYVGTLLETNFVSQRVAKNKKCRWLQY